MENRLCEEARLMRVEAAAAKIDDSSSTKADPKKVEKPLTEEEKMQHNKQAADEQRRQKEKRDAGPRPALIDLGWSKKKKMFGKLFGFKSDSSEPAAPQLHGLKGLKQTTLTVVPREPCWAFEPPGFARTILDTTTPR